jgi:hypothetical protein
MANFNANDSYLQFKFYSGWSKGFTPVCAVAQSNIQRWSKLGPDKLMGQRDRLIPVDMTQTRQRRATLVSDDTFTQALLGRHTNPNSLSQTSPSAQTAKRKTCLLA